MAIKISEDGVVIYENEPDVERELFPNTQEGGAVAPVAVETIESTDPEIEAEENTRYVCGEVSTISIRPTSEGITDVIFYSGTTATVLNLGGGVKMPPWFDTTDLDTETWYEINILDGVYGVVAIWT